MQESEEDGSVPVSLSELNEEYENGIKMLQIERAKVMQDAKRKPRRKTPKAGFYPPQFSEFTMKRVSCTISLSELRKDMTALTAAATSSSESDKNRSFATLDKCLNQFSARECRRKLSPVDCLPPRSAAEEKRQLQAVLRKSMLQQQIAEDVFLSAGSTCGVSSRLDEVKSKTALNDAMSASVILI